MSSSIPRKLRRRINQVVLDVEDLDLKECTRAEFDEEFQRAQDFLDGNGVIKSSDYRVRLLRIKEIAYSNFGVNLHQEVPVVDEALKYRDYAGVSERSFLRLHVETTQYSIKQFYGDGRAKKSGLLWKFNRAGRIASVSAVSPIFRSSPQEMIVAQNGEEVDWKEARVTTFQIPKEIFELRPYFANDPARVYLNTLRWGHITSRKLLEHIQAGTTLDPFQDNEISLRMASEDPFAMSMLKKAGELFPHLYTKGDLLFLEYRPNRVSS